MKEKRGYKLEKEQGVFGGPWEELKEGEGMRKLYFKKKLYAYLCVYIQVCASTHM